MPRFRRVDGKSAGPAALGVLVPPGRRSLVVVRPRALDWDLLLALPAGCEIPSLFWEAPREHATTLAERVHQALEDEHGSVRSVLAVPLPGGDGFRLIAAVDDFKLITCGRNPGKPYRPMMFSCASEAQDAAASLTAVLSPPPEGNQELYLNVDAFAR